MEISPSPQNMCKTFPLVILRSTLESEKMALALQLERKEEAMQQQRIFSANFDPAEPFCKGKIERHTNIFHFLVHFANRCGGPEKIFCMEIKCV